MDSHDKVVHGVLYKLSEQDFATICQTEGVPFAYSLHRCRAIPYEGDGNTAGKDALNRAMSSLDGANVPGAKSDGNSDAASIKQSTTTSSMGVSAFTLRAARKEWRQGKDVPPSQSYLNVLIQGAKEFVMDETYLGKLENTPVGRTWIRNGLAEDMPCRAEQRNK